MNKILEFLRIKAPSSLQTSCKAPKMGMMVAAIKIDELIRSQRRTTGLEITRDARLIVRAPFWASEEDIYRLIRQKEAWIKSKLDYFKERQNKMVPRKFVPGEEFLFLGKPFPLIVVEDLTRAVVLGDALMVSLFALNNAKDHIENWYKSQALSYITQKVKDIAQRHALIYHSVRINHAASRWGSCGYRDSLNFSWKLIMAPERVVEYVIVHELAHIKQKNHSKKFWAQVALMMPDYKLHEGWLKKNGHLLVWAK